MGLGEGIEGLQRKAQRLADVADRALRPVADDHAGEGRAVAAVLRVQVLQHLFAPLVLEIDVDVRRFVAFLRDEALEQHAHPRRVDLGHADAVADDAVRRAAAALAEDVARAREGHDVGDGQEVVLVLEVADQFQLVLDLRLHLGRHAAGPAAPGAFVGDAPKVGRGRLARRHHLVRVSIAQLVEAEDAAGGHVQGLGEQFRGVGLRQAQPGAQVPLGVGLQVEPALGQRFADTRGGQHVLQRLARAHMEVHVAGRHQRDRAGAADLAQPVQPHLVGQQAQQVDAEPAAANELVQQPLGDGGELRRLAHALG